MPSDIRKTLDSFILAALKASEALSHERAVPLEELATSVGIGRHLAEKIAAYLEAEGLVDYDDRAIDITIDGILRAEEILRGGERRDQKDRSDAADRADKPAEPNGAKATAARA